ncbi:MAG: hypothetical protein IT357_11165 [Gemmatimonadaceae bacterium]|nr:hypothetical protein [Gemmatimonadaceae bacterium]
MTSIRSFRTHPLPRAIAIACVLGVASLWSAACAGSGQDKAPKETPYVGVIDSALPIDTLLRRFRATLVDTPTTLVGGTSSRAALARQLLTALATRDPASVRRLVLSRAEFAWLYYPHTKFTAPPYELGPELVWIPLIGASEKGAGRLLERLGGRTLRYERLLCPDSSVVEGPNRITTGCAVRFSIADSAAVELRLFSSFVERDGRVKVLSYANDL